MVVCIIIGDLEVNKFTNYIVTSNSPRHAINHAAKKLFIRKFLQSGALNLILPENKQIVTWSTIILSKFNVMLSLLQVSPTIFNASIMHFNLTFTSFAANILTPSTVSLFSHNLKTAKNLLDYQEDISIPQICHVQSIC